MGATFAAVAVGGQRLQAFSAQVSALDETPLENPPPRVFDPRTDIWFDPEDSGLRAYYALENQFIGEDLVSVAFEETDDPWGVFGVDALQSIARLSEALEQVPNVRNVRSLTTNPWIRWGDAGDGEEGLLVSDLFENDPESYSEDERLERMIAVLGAERAAALAGEDAVRRVLGVEADFADHIGEPRLLKAVVSEDGRSAALLVQVLRRRASPEALDRAFGDDESGRSIGPTIRIMERQQAALDGIEAAVAEEDDYEFHIAGLPVFEREFLRVGMSDMAFVGLMFAAIALVLLLVFRRIGAVVVPLTVVFAAIMGMNGAVWMAGDLINNLTAVAPVMITAIGIADAVHLVTAYYLLRPRFDSKEALIGEVLKRNALAVLLTSITTAVGFFSLVTSEIVPVQMLGYTAGLGTIMAYALSMTLVPALLSLIPLRKKKNATEAAKKRGLWERVAGRWVNAILARRGLVLGVSAAIVGVAGIGLSRIEIESDMRMMFPKDSTIIRDLYWTEDHIGGGSDLEIVFYGPELRDDDDAVEERRARLEALALEELEGELSADAQEELRTLRAADADHNRRRIAASERFLSQVDAFQRRIEAEAENAESPLRVLTNFDSALAVLRKMHQVQNEGSARSYRVPNDGDVPVEARQATVSYDDILEEAVYVPPQNASTLVSQYYLQYENGAKPSENLSSLVSVDRRGFRIAARTRTAPTTVLLGAFARLREVLRTDFPELAGDEAALESGDALATTMLSGKQYLFTNMLTRFSSTLVQSVGLALFVITLLIGFVFRSASVALVSLIPNVLPIVVPLGFFGLMGLPLDGPAVLVATVALGVCVDDTIHFLTKYTHARRDGLGLEDALRVALEQVGSALTWTTVILVVGFGMLGFSDFRPNMIVGIVGAVMIALAWVADFIVTPAALALFARRQEASAPLPAPAE
ncbi:MAG: MMPL family transporter [Myxococcota bacterium]